MQRHVCILLSYIGLTMNCFLLNTVHGSHDTLSPVPSKQPLNDYSNAMNKAANFQDPAKHRANILMMLQAALENRKQHISSHRSLPSSPAKFENSEHYFTGVNKNFKQTPKVYDSSHRASASKLIHQGKPASKSALTKNTKKVLLLLKSLRILLSTQNNGKNKLNEQEIKLLHNILVKSKLEKLKNKGMHSTHFRKRLGEIAELVEMFFRPKSSLSEKIYVHGVQNDINQLPVENRQKYSDTDLEFMKSFMTLVNQIRTNNKHIDTVANSGIRTRTSHPPATFNVQPDLHLGIDHNSGWRFEKGNSNNFKSFSKNVHPTGPANMITSATMASDNKILPNTLASSAGGQRHRLISNGLFQPFRTTTNLLHKDTDCKQRGERGPKTIQRSKIAGMPKSDPLRQNSNSMTSQTILKSGIPGLHMTHNRNVNSQVHPNIHALNVPIQSGRLLATNTKLEHLQSRDNSIHIGPIQNRPEQEIEINILKIPQANSHIKHAQPNKMSVQHERVGSPQRHTLLSGSNNNLRRTVRRLDHTLHQNRHMTQNSPVHYNNGHTTSSNREIKTLGQAFRNMDVRAEGRQMYNHHKNLIHTDNLMHPSIGHRITGNQNTEQIRRIGITSDGRILRPTQGILQHSSDTRRSQSFATGQTTHQSNRQAIDSKPRELLTVQPIYSIPSTSVNVVTANHQKQQSPVVATHTSKLIKASIVPQRTAKPFTSVKNIFPGKEPNRNTPTVINSINSGKNSSYANTKPNKGISHTGFLSTQKIMHSPPVQIDNAQHQFVSSGKTPLDHKDNLSELKAHVRSLIEKFNRFETHGLLKNTGTQINEHSNIRTPPRKSHLYHSPQKGSMLPPKGITPDNADSNVNVHNHFNGDVQNVYLPTNERRRRH